MSSSCKRSRGVREDLSLNFSPVWKSIRWNFSIQLHSICVTFPLGHFFFFTLWNFLLSLKYNLNFDRYIHLGNHDHNQNTDFHHPRKFPFVPLLSVSSHSQATSKLLSVTTDLFCSQINVAKLGAQQEDTFSFPPKKEKLKYWLHLLSPLIPERAF